jgi:hypothetical protein
MAKNKMTDLNNHLFLQLERLNDEELNGEKLQEEIHRAKAITCISKEIVSSAKLQLEVVRLISESGEVNNKLPEMLMLNK